MNDTQFQIDHLIELAVLQRAELKTLVDSMPQLRDHLSEEIERNLEEAEPAIRSELEQLVIARAKDAHAESSAALNAKIEELAKALEITTAAKYSVLMAERAENANLLAKAEARIEDAAAMLSGAVKEIVTDELSRFPRAGEIDQLRKEFAEPRGLNPRGRWMVGETYNKLDLVTMNGDSFVSNIDGNRERPSRTAGDWTLSAARGNGGGGGVTSMTDLVPVPSNGEILIGNGSAFVNSTLTAGTGISISNGSGSITINATDGNITLDDGTAAAPSLNFTNYPTTGLYSSAANAIGFATSGVSRATLNSTGLSLAGTLGVTGVATLGAGAILNTPASGTLTNATGLPISTGVSGLGTGVATFLATPSSSNLAAAVTDETGSGALVFATSPTLTTPISATLTSPASTALTLGTGTSGAAVTVLSASNNVGIGTTSPGDKLTVTPASGTNPGITINATSAITGGSTLSLNTTTQSGGVIWQLISNGTLNAGGAGALSIHDATAALNRITILPTSGYVGIGTVIPSGPLSVTPLQYSTGTASQALFVVTGVGTTFTAAMVGSQFVYANGVSSGAITAFTNATTITVSVSQTVSSQAYGISYTGLQIASTGNVGIGTTGPTSPLHIKGTSQYALTVENSTVTSGASALFQNTNSVYVGVDNSSGSALGSTLAYSAVVSSSGAYPLALLTTSLPRLTILSGGNVGIGTTTPSTKLEVAGVIKTTDTTPSIDSSSGALQVAGGVGIAGNLYVGGTTFSVASTTNAKVAVDTSSNSPSLALISNAQVNYRTLKFGYGAGATSLWQVGYQGGTANTNLNFEPADPSYVALFLGTTASTGVGSGALQVAGGIYAGAASVFGSTATFAGAVTVNTISGINALAGGTQLATFESSVDGAVVELITKGKNSTGTARQANIGINRFADNVLSFSNGTTESLRLHLTTQAATFAGAVTTSSTTLSGAGAIPITTSLVKFTSTGAAQALTLANGVDGQRLTIVHDVDGGSGVLTPTTKTGFTTVTFTNAGDTVSLVYVTTQGWMVTGSYLATIAP